MKISRETLKKFASEPNSFHTCSHFVVLSVEPILLVSAVVTIVLRNVELDAIPSWVTLILGTTSSSIETEFFTLITELARRCPGPSSSRTSLILEGTEPSTVFCFRILHFPGRRLFRFMVPLLRGTGGTCDVDGVLEDGVLSGFPVVCC